MEWIFPLLGLITLVVFIFLLLSKPEKPKEVMGVLLFATALFVYHVGDMLMWGWSNTQVCYDLFRSIASLGYYLEIPALLYLGYVCIPAEKRTQFTKIFSWILVVPWIIAIILLFFRMPNNYLTPPNIPAEIDPGINMNLIYVLILFYIISVIFVVIKTLKGAKLLEGAGQSLCKMVGIITLIQLIAYLIIFAFAETYDATYLFGLISIFWIVMVGKEALAVLKKG